MPASFLHEALPLLISPRFKEKCRVIKQEMEGREREKPGLNPRSQPRPHPLGPGQGVTSLLVFAQA